QVLVVIVVEALHVDADFRQQSFGDAGVPGRRIDGFSAAVADARRAADGELIALGVAAEVVMVIENQDPRLRLFLPEEVRGRQTADATADDYQVVFRVRGGVRPG